ncbi:hypothetical protein CSOJ01_15677 [Colletotrichum sojae]|uniref:Uncharacterized protein n=1 Tax=Colletotrichum sojae TaxID=2175907 RepID=A0A8H6IMA5_9PEZI|nr:hypothetical protein CSOJ01_15677 [Colletotrichum sojae]
MNLFRDNCSKVGIEEHQLAPAFSIMLRGKASIFYANRLCGRGIRDFDTMVDNVRRYFETEEKRQSYLSEWRETTFNRIMQKHPDKSKTQVLDDLIEKLALIQRALPVSYHSDEVLRTQLLNACSGIKESSGEYHGEEEGDTFFTSTVFYGSTALDGSAVAANLADQSFYHQLTKQRCRSTS